MYTVKSKIIVSYIYGHFDGKNGGIMEKHPMRRSLKEITDPLVIDQLLKKTSVCHLAMSDGGQPYVVPMNYGYADGSFYLHCATEGRKLAVLSRNNRVCIEVVVEYAIESAESACDWTTHFTSVIGFGTAHILEDPLEKEAALNILMQSFTGIPKHAFSTQALGRVCVIRVDTTDIRAKDSSD